MPPELVALSEGPSILLDKPIVLIGRHQECDIQIPSRKISRRHCCIAQVNDHLVIRDLCSTNGIRINGVRVQEGCLNSGDEVTIGNFRYAVRFGAEGEAPPPKQPAKRDRRADVDNPFMSLDEPVLLKDSGSPLVPGGVIPKAPGVKPPPAEPSPFILPDNLELASASGDFPPSQNAS